MTTLDKTTSNIPVVSTTAAQVGSEAELKQSISSISMGISSLISDLPEVTAKQRAGNKINIDQTSRLLDTLREILPKGFATDSEIVLMQLAKDLEKTQGKIQNIGIQAETSRRKADIGELDKKQKQNEAARQEAERKRSTASIFSKIASFFSAIATIIGGAVLAIANPVAGALVITIGSVMLVNEIVKEASGKSMFAHMGMSADAEQWLLLGLTIAAAAVSIGIAVKGALSAVMQGAKMAAQEGVKEGAKEGAKAIATEAAKESAKEAVKKGASEGMKATMKQVAAGIGVGEAAFGIANAGVQYDASMSHVKLKEKTADYKELEALFEALKEFLERSINQYSDIEQAVQQLMEKAYESAKNKQTLVMSIKTTV